MSRCPHTTSPFKILYFCPSYKRAFALLLPRWNSGWEFSLQEQPDRESVQRIDHEEERETTLLWVHTKLKMEKMRLAGKVVLTDRRCWNFSDPSDTLGSVKHIWYKQVSHMKLLQGSKAAWLILSLQDGNKVLPQLGNISILMRRDDMRLDIVLDLDTVTSGYVVSVVFSLF